MSSLASFQDRFAASLVSDVGTPGPHEPWQDQPAFAVYRNTVARAWMDALAANFPSVARLAGDQWFRAAAMSYARRDPCTTSSLSGYGEAFPEYAGGIGDVSDMPYLGGVARLDRCWTESHTAADAPVLRADAVAGLSVAELAVLRLHPHPAARWAWFGDTPAASIWMATREGRDDLGDIAWQGAGALLTRPADAVVWRSADVAACAFLDSCARGDSVAAAAGAALSAQPDADLARLMSSLLVSGAFTRAATSPEGVPG